MAGLFGFLGIGALLGDTIIKSAHEDLSYKYGKENAIAKGKEYFRGDRGWYWTETGEPITIDYICGMTVYTGVKSGRVYKRDYGEKSRQEDSEKERLKKAINYCKAAEYKYLPWNFNTNVLRDRPGCTGIEIETGRKYYVLKEGWNHHTESYFLVYLEDEPHMAWSEARGNVMEYDATHDGDERMFRKGEAVCNTHRSKLAEKNYQYYSIKYPISKQEYEERLEEVDNYPVSVLDDND